MSKGTESTTGSDTTGRTIELSERDRSSPDDEIDGRVYRTRHDADSGNSLSSAVVMAVAETVGVDPSEVTPTLYDILDPDALDALFAKRNDGGRCGHVEFTQADCAVTVHADGRIEIWPLTSDNL